MENPALKLDISKQYTNEIKIKHFFHSQRLFFVLFLAVLIKKNRIWQLLYFAGIIFPRKLFEGKVKLKFINNN